MAFLNMVNIMDIRELTIEYVVPQGAVKALEDVTLGIPAGKITAIIGESGCGKSTLANAMLGLLPGNASVVRGQVLFEGRDILRMSEQELAAYRWRRAAMVFQAALSALNPTLTVRQQMLDTIIDHGLYDPIDSQKKIVELLKMVNLEPARVLDSYPHQLSGGQRQRVMIALALLLDPEILILDEPTTALDVITQFHIFEIFQKIHRQTGTTMVLITHDIALAARISHFMAVMYAGRLMEFGPTREVISNPAHPYTRGLLESLPRIESGQFVPKPIPGYPPDLINKPLGCVFHPRCSLAVEKCRQLVPNTQVVAEQHVAACFFPMKRGD